MKFKATISHEIATLTVKDGATLGSILPSYIFGYKVKENNATKWYDKDTVGDAASLNNVVSISQLPVKADPVLTLNGKDMAEISNVLASKQLNLSFPNIVTGYWGGTATLFIQKEGESVTDEIVSKDNGQDIYGFDPKTLETGTYKVWATASKEGYTRRSKTYTLNVLEKLAPTGNPELSDNAVITYGEPISKITLSGTLRDEDNDIDVEGTFEWVTPGATPVAGICEAGWIFTPNKDYADTYAPVTGKARITVNKAEVTYTKPAAIDYLEYKIDDDNPQVLHTKEDATGGTMKYTLDNPDSPDADWSEKPLTSRNAGTFTVYYKVFGDDNHLDSDWGKIECSIAQYELFYKILCKPKVYDGTTEGDPGEIEYIKFFSTKDDNPPREITLDNNDYKINSITYKSENVGGNLGDEPVAANADVTLLGTAGINYKVDSKSSTASGCITPALFENISKFGSYTYKVCYNDINPKTVTAPYFGAPGHHANYEIYSDMASFEGDRSILSVIEPNGNIGIKFAIAEGLDKKYEGKSFTLKDIKIYSKNHNYWSGKLSLTVEIADRRTPDLSVTDIEAVYNGEAVSINGTATVDGYKIDGEFYFIENAPVNVSDSGTYEVGFKPKYTEYYYENVRTTVKVTITPRDIGGDDVAFTYVDSHTYTGKAITPAVSAKYGEKNLEAGKDYKVTYPQDATNAGQKKITVTGVGNFGGTTELVYEITPCEKTPEITLPSNEKYTYDETEKTPKVTVTVDGVTLVENEDYKVTYSNNINAGDSAKVTVTAIGNYAFETQEKYFSIRKGCIRNRH